jgi:3-methyl-2-oxobutanoate hydroxymethyltransferase
MKRTPAGLIELKRLGSKITMLTAYDAPTAAAEAEAGIDVILVGDSVGTNVLGYASEREVTLADIAHHVRAARRGAADTHILADLPYGTYETPEAAIASAAALRAAGADSVKLEGPRTAVIEGLTRAGYAVCGHTGLEPQHHDQIGVKGKSAADALRILEDAAAIARAGAFMLVLELIPEELGGLVSRRVPIPTIGIGAGRETDGQVLVINDVLGLNQRSFRHNRRYRDLGTPLREAVANYRRDVQDGAFPSYENASHMPEEALEAVRAAIA